jgi:CO/xanthine dehydrogenase FAD-binding subunit
VDRRPVFLGACRQVTDVRYLKPKDLTEASSLLASKDLPAKALAGGTDLLVQWRRGKVSPACLVDLKGLGLNQIAKTVEGDLRIGALCTLNSVLENEIVRKQYPILIDSIAELASVQVRHRATLGGNLCNASPAADTASPLLALKATATLSGPQGTRKLPLAQFFQGPGQTCLLSGELLTEIVLPMPSERSGGVYLKMKRSAMDLALVGVAVFLVMENQEECSEGRIFLGAVAPIPLYAQRASETLRKTLLTKEMGKAATLAAEEARPIDDVRATAWYRKKVVRVLTERAIQRAGRRAAEKIPRSR